MSLMNRSSVLAVLVLSGAVLAGLASNAEEPWRFSKAAELPSWLDITGVHRARYETLDGQFRVGRTGGDQAVALRTTIRGDVKIERFGATAELIDSRQELSDAGTPMDTTMVNTVEMLQVYGSIRMEGVFVEGSESELRVGRQTMDFGSRRVVARNAFRNTINAFTGVHYQLEMKDGPVVRAIYVLPINRLPADAPSLLNNQIQFDEERFEVQLWGLHTQWKGLPLGGVGEVYLFGLHEDDSEKVPSRNRELYTPGVRFHRARGKGGWDYDFESVVQVGTARNSTAASDVTPLDHFAHFHHGEIGYTAGVRWSPRGALVYDYGSGDDSPSDGDSNRFDTLFGARRFDHGPTGIYGAFGRSNIQSPGLILGARPASLVETEVKYRPYWLASNTDAWATSGLRDATGSSGSFIGHQVEASVRWDVRMCLRVDSLRKPPMRADKATSRMAMRRWNCAFETDGWRCPAELALATLSGSDLALSHGIALSESGIAGRGGVGGIHCD